MAVILLTPDHQAIGLFQQTAGGGAHDQRRHQIFEHGPRPRDQGRTIAQGRGGAAQPEPVARAHIALGDGEQAGQPSFRGQQIIAIEVKTVVGKAIADGQQFALGIEQKGEVHGQGHLPRRIGDRL